MFCDNRLTQLSTLLVPVIARDINSFSSLEDVLPDVDSGGSKPFRSVFIALAIAFVLFDLWHYDSRTSKHGAFMGGADFVKWHGNYELLKKHVELEAVAEELHGKRLRGK